MAHVKKVFLTIDVDFTNYLSHVNFDEMEVVFDKLKAIFIEFPEVKSTWYIRIDDQIKSLHKKPDYIFIKHNAKLDWLRNTGHQLAWHHHAYKFENHKWKQELEITKVKNAIERNARIALEYGLESCRMGWGYHTNETMKLVDDLGFTTDSSAIPRPNYAWETSKKNWEITPQSPYHPSLLDYRTAGVSPLKILEVPFSTTQVSAASDTEKNIIRYINPAYHTGTFKQAVNSYKYPDLVIVVHPYELIKHKGENSSLIAFNIDTFRTNLKYLINEKFEFQVINDLL